MAHARYASSMSCAGHSEVAQYNACMDDERAKELCACELVVLFLGGLHPQAARATVSAAVGGGKRGYRLREGAGWKEGVLSEWRDAPSPD